MTTSKDRASKEPTSDEEDDSTMLEPEPNTAEASATPSHQGDDDTTTTTNDDDDNNEDNDENKGSNGTGDEAVDSVSDTPSPKTKKRKRNAPVPTTPTKTKGGSKAPSKPAAVSSKKGQSKSRSGAGVGGGGSGGGSGHYWTVEQDKMALQLREEGKTMTEIAERLNDVFGITGVKTNKAVHMHLTRLKAKQMEWADEDVEKLREAMASFKAVKRERLITESFRKLLGAEDAKKYTAEQIDAKIKSLEAGKGK